MKPAAERRVGGTRRGAKAALMLAGLLLGSTAAEVGLRLAHCDETLWGGHNRWRGYDDYDLNEHGLRGGDSAWNGERRERRILAIGDSHTFGEGVAAEDAWPAVLERLLLRAGEDAEVLNGGIVGSSTRYQAEFWIPVIPDLDPDLIVLGYYLNDAADQGEAETFLPPDQPALALLGEAIFTAESSARPALGRLLLFHIARAGIWGIYDEAAGLLGARRPDFFLMAYDPGRNEMYDEWEVSISRIASAAREDGIPLVVFVIPYLPAMETDAYPYDRIHDLIAERWREAGVEVIDTREAISALEPPYHLGLGDDHPTPEVQYALARTILPDVISNRDRAR